MTPTTPNCPRCQPRKPCLNHIAIWKQGEWLGRHLWADNRIFENTSIKLRKDAK
jgi:hypothetical protein